MTSEKVEEHEVLKQKLMGNLDDLVVLMLANPSELLASFRARRRLLEPVIQAIDDLITF